MYISFSLTSDLLIPSSHDCELVTTSARTCNWSKVKPELVNIAFKFGSLGGGNSTTSDIVSCDRFETVLFDSSALLLPFPLPLAVPLTLVLFLLLFLHSTTVRSHNTLTKTKATILHCSCVNPGILSFNKKVQHNSTIFFSSRRNNSGQAMMTLTEMICRNWMINISCRDRIVSTLE